MKFLTDLGNQLREMFFSLTPAARVIAGLLVVAIVVSFSLLVRNGETKSWDYIHNGMALTDSQIRNYEMAFSEASLNEWVVEGRRIKVPSGQRAEYIAALSKNGAMPRGPGEAKEDAIKNGNVWDPGRKFDESIRHAKTREVANWLEALPGIEWADVQYDEQRRGFPGTLIQTASVAIRPISNQPIGEGRMREIAKTVAANFAGLQVENVRVTDISNGATYSPADATIGGMDDPYKRQQQAYEEDYRRRIRELLSNYGDVKLEVGVTLDEVMLNETQQLKYDPQATTIEANTSRKDEEMQRLTPGGRPGTQPNSIGNQPQSIATSPDQSSKTKETSENERRVVGQELTKTAKAGLTPERVSVSVGLPDSYLQKVFVTRWLQINKDKKATDAPPPTALELQNLFKESETSIQEAITPMLPPVPAGADVFPLVKVYQFPDLPVEPIPSPTFAAQATTFLAESWQTIALLTVVLLGLGFVAMHARSNLQAKDDPFRDGFGITLVDKIQDNIQIASGDDGEGDNVKEKSTLRQIEVTGQELKDNLSNMIQENPDAAVNLLRTWIGEAV